MVKVALLELQAHKLFSPLLHYIKHVPNAVTLLQSLLVTLKLIPEVLDDEPFQTFGFLVSGCGLDGTFSAYGLCMLNVYAMQCHSVPRAASTSSLLKHRSSHHSDLTFRNSNVHTLS